MFKKDMLVKIVFDWCLQAKKFPGGYKIEAESLGFDPNECVKSMTSKQLKFVSALAAAIYGKGCDDSRRWNKELQESKTQILKEYADKHPEITKEIVTAPLITPEDYGFPGNKNFTKDDIPF